MMATGLESRVERLEAVAKHRTRAMLPALVLVNPNAIQQAEINQARAAGRVVITIRCSNPIQLPPELLEIRDFSGETQTPGLDFERVSLRDERRISVYW